MTNRQKRLVENFIPLAKSICKEFESLDYQDRYSEALYGLVIAAKKFNYKEYDIDRFPQYAKMTIRNRLKSLYNKSSKRLTVDWQSVEGGGTAEDASLQKYLEEEDDDYYNMEALRTCQKELTQEAYEIVIYLLEDKNQSEIANEFDVSQATISRRIKRIKEDLNEHFRG